MRILHIIAGLSDGGAEAVLYRACRAGGLDEHVVVSLSDRGKYGAMLEALGAQVYCLRMNAGILGVVGLLGLFRILRKESPDVVQTWMYHADFIGGLFTRLVAGIPVFWGVHNTVLVPGESKRITILISRINARLSYIVPRKIIFCAQKSRIVHQGLGYDDRRAVVIHNGYDVKSFHPDPKLRASIRSELEIEEGVPVVGFVGRLDPQKDHDNLFAAVRVLHERGVVLKCLLAGAGLEAENSSIISKLRFYGLDKSGSIVLMGKRADIPAVMNALDVHVLSSSAEAFPNVLCEAMACGTPCVTTDVGDAAIIVGDTGWIVPPKKSEDLADAIQEALHEHASMPEHWNRRQIRARQRIVEKFDIDTMYSSYRKQWRDSIDPVVPL